MPMESSTWVALNGVLKRGFYTLFKVFYSVYRFVQSLEPVCFLDTSWEPVAQEFTLQYFSSIVGDFIASSNLCWAR